MNKETMHGKWNEIKGEIRRVWGNITGGELEQSKGNLTSIAGLIQHHGAFCAQGRGKDRRHQKRPQRR